MSEHVEARTERMVAGGAALGRLPDGRRALLDGALPGELVVGRVTRTQPGLVHATTVDVIEAAPDRVEPPCPLVRAGCGGCDWQHIDASAQPKHKRGIVVDALTHIAHLSDAPVDATVALPVRDYRTTIRGVATEDGTLGLRRTRSHDPIGIAGCLIAHPRLRELIDGVRFAAGTEVTVRVGAGTGDRLVLGHGARPSPLPEDVAWVDARRRGAAARTTFRVCVDDVELDVPAASFFQPHVEAPARLSALVREIVADEPRLADLYCGVGLFATTVPAASVVAVERDRVSARAATHNVRRSRGKRGSVVASAVERAEIGEVDAVVADPNRAGLGRAGTEAIARTGASTIALVSCDPASFARDAGLFTDLGYELTRAVPVDQFGHTSHIEVVGEFKRGRPRASRARRPR